jgi:hypothetical protein
VFQRRAGGNRRLAGFKESCPRQRNFARLPRNFDPALMQKDLDFTAAALRCPKPAPAQK